LQAFLKESVFWQKTRAALVTSPPESRTSRQSMDGNGSNGGQWALAWAKG